MSRYQTIRIHAAAPPKPAVGEPCNGCGVCCVSEACPVAMVLFLRRHGKCPALQWCDREGRYRCGLVADPQAHLSWLPAGLSSWFSRRAQRFIASGQGCDCDTRVEAD